ncbi:DMT family transporter [Pseudothermotoga sp.]|nr:DMT family transporter [Pseudothermotoga sp.]MCX7813655.1 DMT family transporter [Pseudothermotoga sp.]MDW8139498.1 DMT family transporter [Pseudothermotoga sp.]
MSLKVILSGFCVSLIFGLSFLFTKNALDYVEPLTFLSYRFFVGSLFFLLLALTRVIKLERRPYWKLWKLVIFQPILYFLFETFGLQKISSAEAGMIVALIPIVVNVFAAFLLKEKGDLFHYILVINGFVGSILIVGFNISAQNFTGKLFMLFAVLSAALYNISARKLSKEFSPYEITFFMMISGFIFFSLMSLVSERFRIVLNVSTVFGALYLGVFSSAVAFFLLNYMVKHASPILTSLFSNFTSVVALVAGMFFRSESVEIRQIFGICIVLISLFLIAYRKRGTIHR